MIRKKYIIAMLTIIQVLITNAQVGIGTDNPQADLHVAGDLLVQDAFEIGTLGTISPTDKGFNLIARVKNSTPVGEIAVLNLNTLDVGPINVINYHFSNLNLDNVTDADLQFDANKYVVSISNFRYVGDAIKKVPSGSSNSIGNFVVNTFTSGGTWHLEIRNRTLDLDVGDFIEYYVTLTIFDKSYFKNLTPITTDMGGSNTGTASSIPVLF
jgi:hypothetical protein